MYLAIACKPCYALSVSRYVLVINGRKALHEALVTKSVDFAGRPQVYINTFINPRDKGRLYFFIGHVFELLMQNRNNHIPLLIILYCLY